MGPKTRFNLSNLALLLSTYFVQLRIAKVNVN